MRYTAKRSASYIIGYSVVIMLLVAVFIFSVCFFSGAMRVVVPIVTLGIGGVFTWFFVDLSYTLTDTELIIKFGFVVVKINRMYIINVVEEDKFTLNFALSKKCLALYYGLSNTRKYNKFYVAPKDTQGFLLNLKSNYGGVSNFQNT